MSHYILPQQSLDNEWHMFQYQIFQYIKIQFVYNVGMYLTGFTGGGDLALVFLDVAVVVMARWWYDGLGAVGGPWVRLVLGWSARLGSDFAASTRDVVAARVR